MRSSAAALLLVLGASAQGPTFVVLGVCEIDDQAVACWDPGGRPSSELTAYVRRRVEALVTPLSFVVGRKNRFVLVRHAPYAYLQYVRGGESLQNYPVDPEGTMTLFRLAADARATTASFDVSVGQIEGSSVDLPFREGAAAALGGVRIELGKVEENPPGSRSSPFFGPMGFGPARFSRWRIPVGRGESTPAGTFQFEAIDRHGKPIRYVDRNGKPVTDMRAEEYRRRRFSPDGLRNGPPLIDAARMNVGSELGQGQPDLIWVGFSIDPKAIAKLRVRRIAEYAETVGPIALDPLQPSVP